VAPEAAVSYRTPLDIGREVTEEMRTDEVPDQKVPAEAIEIQLGGFGGQGIILSGKIIGRSQAIYEERQVSLTRSYGPEARGGACGSALIVSDGPILYPHVTRPNIMVMMSQAAYTKYHDKLAEDGLLLVDADLVKLDPDADQKVIAVPATHLAEEDLGPRIVANIVMLGSLTALTDVLSKEAMRQAVLDSVPQGTEDLNERAFNRGYEVGMELLKKDN
jgi:2-oxoglutarate ferredoxin oxidoreductase subunit gamma